MKTKFPTASCPSPRCHRKAFTLLHACCLLLCSAIFFSPSVSAGTDAPAQKESNLERGLLFYVSSDKGTTADYSAAGTPSPTFDSEITIISDGARGAALSCGDFQRLAWSAPGNIYSQRGTLSFFWRSRYPVGPTEFPVFRVGYGDSSSWDMVWLRIDYNGHGFDAFVTDASLSRIRVSTTLSPFPAPSTWTHIAFTWDETTGVRLYINGKLAVEKKLEHPTRLDTALDQFGPHSRIISPHNVQSDYNFTRGGDIDEIRIHDRALTGEEIANLVTTGATQTVKLAHPDNDNKTIFAAFLHRYGFDNPDNTLSELTAPTTSIRKVEIHDAFDQKRWWWKACDGIRETTWPGVYNRSRLPGRHDYFELPDWDCYSTSGKAITFHMPDEPWNHLEISGAAHGKVEILTMPAGMKIGYAKGETPPYDDTAAAVTPLFERPQYAERTTHQFATAVSGSNKRIRFTNTEQEEPIGEFSAYYVAAGSEPANVQKYSYRFSTPKNFNKSLTPLHDYIVNRHPDIERAILSAEPDSGDVQLEISNPTTQSLPLVHILIPPSGPTHDVALDGIAIDLPALQFPRAHDGDLISFNIQVKDPLWPMRDMFDFTFSLRITTGATQPRALWLDLRDRILPDNKTIYLTIASASVEFTPISLANARLRLVFKPRADGLAEHELDRFTQVRDAYAMLVEESPRSEKFALWKRFATDLRDLLRVNPHHHLGLLYAAALSPVLDDLIDAARKENPSLQLISPLPPPPKGAPLWAVRQTHLLTECERFANWYIDYRQLDDGDAAPGEFGGGISDDTDLTNLWPGLALMGVAPDKIAASDRALLAAAHANGMFTNGINTIQTDELHNYEEGLNTLGQSLIITPSSPQLLEEAMAATRALEGITAINSAGHRHLRTSYYSSTRQATEAPWNTARAYGYLAFQPAQLLADYNASPRVRRLLIELADGLLAHRHATPSGKYVLPTAIRFGDDANVASTRAYLPWPLFWNAWQWTGDKKYLAPILDNGTPAMLATVNPNALDMLSLRNTISPEAFLTPEAADSIARQKTDGTRGNTREGRGTPVTDRQRGSTFAHFLWQLTGNTQHLADLYTAQIETCQRLAYINTEGSLWIDRIGVPTADLQRARLGGVALMRNSTFPGHAVSWHFHAPATAQSLGILIPDATPDSFTIIAHNLTDAPVHATLTGGPLLNPGQWTVSESHGTDEATKTTTPTSDSSATNFGRDIDTDLTFPAQQTTTVTFRKITAATPYAQRPDLAIEYRDVTLLAAHVAAPTLCVRVHNVGAIESPATTLALIDNATGKILATAPIPPIPAPIDLQPKTQNITLPFPATTKLANTRIEIDPEKHLEEISRKNNSVIFSATVLPLEVRALNEINN